jgi:DNA-binding transcriptional regulator GbsR (MarR family)
MKRNAIPSRAGATRNGAAPLNPVELEVISLFVQLSRALGQPPSVAEIYGLLFLSPRPLPQNEFIDRLNLSKGGASMGLRYLLDLGAVRLVEMPDDRRVHYEAVAELRNLVNRFIRHQVLASLEGSDEKLDRLAEAAKKLSDDDRDHVVSRIKTLQSWERNVTRILPIALALLGGGRNGK